MTKWKNLQPGILLSARPSFRFDGEIKKFTEKKNLKEYSTTKSALQERVNELLQAEKKKPQLETRKLQMRRLTGKAYI